MLLLLLLLPILLGGKLWLLLLPILPLPVLPLLLMPLLLRRRPSVAPSWGLAAISDSVGICRMGISRMGICCMGLARQLLEL